MSISWGYDAENCPATWSEKFENAAGKHQSPIDILAEQSMFDPELTKTPLTFSYNSDCFTSLKNTGRGFVVAGSDKASSNVCGGPVDKKHKFLQFHMHWGQTDAQGSEHTINGSPFAAEIHFVNWNSDSYDQPGQACASCDHTGAIVLGSLVKIGKHNAEFDKLVNSLSKIGLSGQSVDLPDNFDYQGLFPADKTAYFSYQGSLTTPPCTEAISWVVFRDAIEVSSEQLAVFRNLYQCEKESECCEQFRLLQNFRPVCDLNGRKVRRSFE